MDRAQVDLKDKQVYCYLICFTKLSFIKTTGKPEKTCHLLLFYLPLNSIKVYKRDDWKIFRERIECSL